MRVRILGCGGSSGVPVIGIGWGDCDPNNPKNRRRRVSILVDDGETTVMIDSAPEMREQLTDVDCRHLDAVVFTHEHADHTHGLNDLRNMAAIMSRRIDIYGDTRTLDSLTTRFSYAFQQPEGSLYRAFLDAHVIAGAVRRRYASHRSVRAGSRPGERQPRLPHRQRGVFDRFDRALGRSLRAP